MQVPGGLAAVAENKVESRLAEGPGKALHDAGADNVGEQLRDCGGVVHPDRVGALETEAAAGGIPHEIGFRAFIDDLLLFDIAHAALAVDRVISRARRRRSPLAIFPSANYKALPP